MYGLMENHPLAGQMQQQAIRQITASRPRYIVQVNVSTSWLTQPESLPFLHDWSFDFLRNLYDVVGVIDLLGPDNTLYIWGSGATGYQPRSEFNIRIFERREQ
jgi:hypothetical protein